MKPKGKAYCSNTECSIKPVKFNTFEYLYCSTCKSEVTEDLANFKDRQKPKKNQVNPHMSDTDEDNLQGDLFDFWSGSV